MTVTLVGALNAALRAALAADDRVLVYGEDVAALGGVFRVTDGLSAEFGDRRVFDSPLAESALVGTAVGFAMAGYRPVLEMQFDAFTYPAFAQIAWHLARFRFRSRGAIAMPVVIRIPYGGGIGSPEHHSESPETYFTPTAGLKVFTPATPLDAYALLREAIADDDPVIFFEPKHDYWMKQDVDLPGESLPAGQAVVRHHGEDVTVVAYGPALKIALAAAEFLESEQTGVEVVDLRTLNPLDTETVAQSVSKTHRLVMVHEAPVFGGFGGEVVARVVERCFGELVAPPARVGAFSVPYPPAALEEHYLPSVDRVVDSIDATLAYK